MSNQMNENTKSVIGYMLQDSLTKTFNQLYKQWSHAADTISEEVRYKSQYLGRAAEPLSDMVAAVQEELRPITLAISNEYNKMYWANEFHLKDTHLWVARHYKEARYV